MLPQDCLYDIKTFIYNQNIIGLAVFSIHKAMSDSKVIRVTTRLKNLEMSGNIMAVRELKLFVVCLFWR